MGALVAVCGTASAFLSFWPSALPLFSNVALKGCFFAMLFVASLYFAEKERHLRQLTRLLLDERVLTTALTDRLHEIGALLEAGAAVNSAHELDTVLEIILGRAIELLGGSGGSILRREDNTLVTISTLGDGFRVGHRVPMGEGPAGRAARIREALLLLDEHDRGDSGTNGHHRDEPGSTMAVRSGFGCRGTTGPGSLNPATGCPYAMSLPPITIADMVRLQKMLIDRQHIL